jgi:hypothetical protein
MRRSSDCLHRAAPRSLTRGKAVLREALLSPVPTRTGSRRRRRQDRSSLPRRRLIPLPLRPTRPESAGVQLLPPQIPGTFQKATTGEPQSPIVRFSKSRASLCAPTIEHYCHIVNRTSVMLNLSCLINREERPTIPICRSRASRLTTGEDGKGSICF